MIINPEYIDYLPKIAFDIERELLKSGNLTACARKFGLVKTTVDIECSKHPVPYKRSMFFGDIIVVKRTHCSMTEVMAKCIDFCPAIMVEARPYNFLIQPKCRPLEDSEKAYVPILKKKHPTLDIHSANVMALCGKVFIIDW